MPSALEVISTALASRTGSRCTPEMHWNSSPSRSRNSTSFSTTSIKKIIRACCAWLRRACAKADLFITDNVLWSGRVAENYPVDARTKAILEFNRKLYDSKEFYTTILPIRDGLAVALKR